MGSRHRFADVETLKRDEGDFEEVQNAEVSSFLEAPM